MKNLLQPLILVLSLFLVVPAQGQFLKKLGNKISKNAERKLEQKIEGKANNQIDKSLEGIFEAPGKIFSDAEKPSNVYEFSYLYQLTVQVEDKEESVAMDYYLQPKSDYVGMAVEQDKAKIFMVMDHGKKAIYNFMDSDGNKMVIPIALNLENLYDDEEDGDQPVEPEFKITDLPAKNILGYNAKGKMMESEEWTVKVYYTEEVPISMADLFNFQTKETKKQNTSAFNKGFDGLPNAIVLEMEGVNKKEKDENVHMVCTKLEEINHSFDASKYKSMF